MSVLEGLDGLGLPGGENQRIAARFSDESLLRARRFFTAHGEEGVLEMWGVLGEMDWLSLDLEDSSSSPIWADTQPRTAALRDKSSALFLAHDDFADSCSGNPECPVFRSVVRAFYSTEDFVASMLSIADTEQLRHGLSRLFGIAIMEPWAALGAFSVFVERYTEDSSVKSGAATHLHLLCDLFDNVAMEDREHLPAEMLVVMSEPT